MSELERDIRAQPAAFRELIRSGPDRWERALTALRGAGGPGPRRIVLCGMGSSYFASVGAAAALRRWGLPAAAALASELLYDGGPDPEPGDWLVAVSQSGESVEVVRLLERLASRDVTVLAVTSRDGNPVAGMSRAVLTLETPPDHGVAVKSFGASLLTLLYLGNRLAGRPPAEWLEPARDAVEALDSLMPSAAEWLALGRAMDPRLHVMVTLARGPVAAAAREAALLGNEVAKFPAWFEEAGEFRHGIIELAGPHTLACLLVPSGPTDHLQVSLARELARTGAPVLATAPPRLADALRDAGARAIPVPDVPEDYAALPHLLPFQWFTVGWAEARGFVPGRFRYIPSVIRSEGPEPGPSPDPGGGEGR